jgi:deoxyribodipyrimidine photo-lyase
VLKRNRDIDRRSRLLVKGERGSGPVVYWMSRDQRAADNWALLWAQQEALIREKPLCVAFCLDPALQAVNQRQHWFMMKGLVELQERLAAFNISFHLLEGRAVEILPDFLHQRDVHLLAADFNPLRGVRKIKNMQPIPSGPKSIAFVVIT